MAELAPLPPLEAWSQRVDLAEAIAEIGSTKLRDKVKRRLAESQQSQQEQFGLIGEERGASDSRKTSHRAAPRQTSVPGPQGPVLSLLKNLFDHRVRSAAIATVGDAQKFFRSRNPVTTVIVKIENHDLDRSAYGRCPKP